MPVQQFLAAMSSSRSDDVTKSVCVSVCSQFVKFGAFKAFEVICFSGVSRVSQVSSGCLKGAPGVFQECLKVLQGCF